MYSEKTFNILLFAVFCTSHLLNNTLCCLKQFFYWNFCWYWFGIGIAEFDKSTNTNSIPAFGMILQYNTKHIVHLRFKSSPSLLRPHCTMDGFI